jgi:multicomponent Na+:H+ antiporter subunit A
MLTAILCGFALSLAAPLFYRFFRETTGWLMALFPLGLVVYFSLFVGRIAGGEVLLFSQAWVPSLGITLSFYLDGLSLLFSMIITGVGVLVLIYASAYLAGHRGQGRFNGLLLGFMSSMLGVVLADNIITLFVFWELTGLFSYLLIGFDHERETAREAALQALLVTGAGGLALLAGLLLLGEAGGSYELSTLLAGSEPVRSHPLYVPILLLVLAGAFTKSAQFPFHFWLPNAMEAPTPVSTYLHSATMVKAGVYLLARLSPVLGGTQTWHVIVVLAGTITMVLGGYLAMRQTDLKRILAYSTVSVLGALIFLLGLGTTRAVEAAMAYLVIHCLYKAALFLVAGIVDHETGTRDVRKLQGLLHVMPVTAFAAALAAFSMAGLPPLFGFIGKELLYGATLEAPLAASILTGVALLTNVFLVAAAGMVGIGPFIGGKTAAPQEIHESPFSMWLGPALLAGLGVFIGLVPTPVAGALVSPAVAAVLAQPAAVQLGLLHGLTVQLALSALTFGLGVAAYLRREALNKAVLRLDLGARLGPARWYRWAVDGMNTLARFQTRLIQSGHLHLYLLIIIVTTVGLVGFSLSKTTGTIGFPEWSGMRFEEWVTTSVILAATVLAVLTKSRLFAVVALGAVGYSVVLIYVMFGAPDLAMTQFSIDTLTVILLVLVLRRLPRYGSYSTTLVRVRDGMPALAAGAVITALTLMAAAVPSPSRLSSYFAENSYLLAKGRNIVNVILVDFRGLDTMGEITVLAVAALGVYSLLRLRMDKEGTG